MVILFFIHFIFTLVHFLVFLQNYTVDSKIYKAIIHDQVLFLAARWCSSVRDCNVKSCRFWSKLELVVGVNLCQV